MEKLKMYTTQDSRVLKEIEETGVYRATLGSIRRKYDTISDLYLKVYKWLSHAADSIVSRPEGVEFPIWTAFNQEGSFGLMEGQVRLELEVEREHVIIFDSGKWDYILNLWYIPLDSKDNEAYEQKLEVMGIKNKSSIYMTNFYPILKREVEQSWQRLFDPEIIISGSNQAVIWEIRSEWIKNTIFPTK
ncbi:DUF3841 domain-containing protein [Dehalobacterium formicoaceticum]|uniref:DUF3841 domain-containing protein n=1 Tax=Dehalobacterium formicoaceticum TaxID=51515 RepID=A0ABT1Y695_9FIRM|nr:DUF3841 domain-containing protein [Dehalobacterium formicoaceticum]MCR6546411.1 DUF3841 domain-containing protein [Dehalobacterium formicoaceticum]